MKEQSKFYSSLGLLLVLNIIIKPVWIFLIDRQVQNQVGTEVYGLYFSLFSFSIVFSFLLDWGLTAFVSRQLATGEGMIYQTSYLLRWKLLLMLLYVIVVGGVALLSGIQEWSLLWKIIGVQMLTSLFVFLRAIITAQQWFRTDAWLSILDKTVMIFLCAGFIYMPYRLGEISIDRFLWIQLLSTLVAIVCAVLILTKKGVLFLGSITAAGAPLFKKALPFAMIVLLMSAHYRLDGFLLEQLHPNGAYEAGIYAAAYRLLDAANMIGFLVASFLLPFISRRYYLKQNIAEAVLYSRHLLVLFSILVGAIAVFMAPWIQRLLYNESSVSAVHVLRFCLPALLGYSLVQVYGSALTATGRIIPFCYIVLVSLIINIVLNILWIPAYGAKGSAIAALTSHGSCGIATMIYASRELGLPLEFRSLVIYIFTGLLLALMLYLSVNSGMNEWIVMAGCGLLIFLVLFITGLFKPHRWNQLLRQPNE